MLKPVQHDFLRELLIKIFRSTTRSQLRFSSPSSAFSMHLVIAFLELTIHVLTEKNRNMLIYFSLKWLGITVREALLLFYFLFFPQA
jgi:hypothetical protein